MDRSSLGLLASPRAGAAWPRRETATAMIGLGIGPRVGYQRAALFRSPRADRPRIAAQLELAGTSTVPYRVPWTKAEAARFNALRVTNHNRGRGPKSYTVTGAAAYSPIPNAAPAPGGITGAISRIATALAGPLQSRQDTGGGCQNCG